MDHEASFVKAFLTSEKRARFLQFLSNPKRRKEGLVGLDRQLPYLPQFAMPVPAGQDFPEELEKLLRAKGAGSSCHVIGAGLKADGRELPLREALDLVCLREEGAILSCLPGQLAYYKPGSPGLGVVLERQPR